MYLRLAFAVAAHLQTEILIVDEVLAVGDAEFQKKCLGKMQDVSRGGRTVIFVSHNMSAIEFLCQRIVHLDKGRLLEDTNNLRGAIAAYLTADGNFDGSSEWKNPGTALRNPWFYPTRFYLGDDSGHILHGPVRNDTAVYVYIEGEVDEQDIALQVGYGLFGEHGTLLCWSVQTDVPEAEWPKLNRGLNQLRSQLPTRTLNQGVYRLDLFIALYHRAWISQPGYGAPAITLTIQDAPSGSPYWMGERPGILIPVCRWSLEEHSGGKSA
jgi:lipopolysaccharide transport system ATP-binding protein